MGGMAPVVFPPPALPGSGYKGMISACVSSRTFPGKGTPLMKYRDKGNAEKLKNKTKEVEKGSIRWQIADFRLQIGGFIHRFTQNDAPVVQRFNGSMAAPFNGTSCRSRVQLVNC